MKREYSLCTLKPNSEQDLRKFRLFRVEDIVEMYSLYMILTLIFYVLIFVSILSGQTNMIGSLVIQTITCVLQLIVWLTRKRFQHRLVWTISVVYIVSLLMSILDGNQMLQTLRADQFSIIIVTLAMQHFFQVWFLCPSFSFVIVKELIFASFITSAFTFKIMTDSGEYNQTLALKGTVANTIRCIATIVIWYVLQKRELTRFY